MPPRKRPPTLDNGSSPLLPKPRLDGKKRRESIGPRRISEILGVSRSTAYRLIWAGEIPAFRVRGALRVTVANLLAFRRANRLHHDPRYAQRRKRDPEEA